MPAYIQFSIGFCFLYGGLSYAMHIFYKIEEIPPDMWIYIIPFIIIGIIILSSYSAYQISESLFIVFFTIYSTFAGFCLYIIQFSFLYHLLSLIIPMSKGVSLFIIIGGGLIVSLYGVINARVIRIDKVNLQYPGFEGKKKICHLSDIHLGALWQRSLCQRIVNKINEMKPDIVVITGDMADGTLRVKSEWMNPFDTLSVPVLYITGNHEIIHGKSHILNAVQKTNIDYMANKVYSSGGMTFIGVDFEYDVRKKLIELKQQYANSKGPNILLSHVPNMKPEELEQYNIFLFLAGHTHGGQIWPCQIFAYLGNKCFTGLYSYNCHYIYVSSGIGAAVIPMRVGAKSVIGEITIEGKEFSMNG